MTEQEQIDFVKEDWRNIKRIQNPSPGVCLAAIKENDDAIYYIKEIPEEAHLNIVEYDPFLHKKIENLTEEAKRKVVHKVPSEIRFMNNPSEEVQLGAVRKNGELIKYIQNPSKAVSIAAIKQNPYSLQYIFDKTEEITMEALRRNGNLIQYIRNPTQEMECEAFLNLTEDAGFFEGEEFPKNSIFSALYIEDKELFINRISQYEETLRHIPYFERIVHHISSEFSEWLPDVINNFSTLTTEQQDIWNKIRLKTLL